MEVNQSIITGLGRDLSLTAVDGVLDLDGPPQATSTLANKKTREDLAGEYLASLEEESERSSGGFKRLRSSTNGQTAIHLILSTNKVNEGDNSGVRSISGGEQEPCSLGSMGAVQLINVDSMSGLSSSRFLVDHTRLGVAEHHHSLTSPEDGRTWPKQHQDTSPLHTTPPKAAPPLPSADSPLSASELSQGELSQEELSSVQGLDPKYLERSPEVLRCQDHSLTQDQSALPSLHSHHFGREDEDEVSGLPLSMVEPQRWREESQGLQEQQDYSQLQASVLCEVEKSKLLSTSCNSLGSLGHNEVDPQALEQSRSCREVGGECGSEWVAMEQGELVSMMEGEEFNSPNLDFFEEEERVHREEHRFEQGDASREDNLDFSNFSGIHGVTEITVRPSWIPSPDRPLVGENNKMAVDDYLRARSDTLGCLGSNENRPNFGTLVHSPPAATRPAQLLSLTQDYSSTLQDYSHSGSSCSDTSESEADISFSNKSQFSDGRQPEKHSASSSMMKKSHLNGSHVNSSVGNKNELIKNENKKSIEEKYKNQKTSAFQGPNKYLPKSKLMKNDFKSNIEEKHTSRKTAGTQLHDICVPNNEEPSEAEISLMQRTIDLEQSLRDMGGSMAVDKITSLLYEAQASHNPQTLITKILGMLKEKAVLHETMDVTNFDMSTDVLELRRQREAVMARAGPCKQPVGKENVVKVIKCPDKKMPQVSQGSNLGVPRKHMEKLQAQRTNSDPGLAYQVQETRYNHLEAKLEDTNIDESIREAQYRSRILEDTAKLQLPSFHESKGIGVETSTPCPSRGRVQANIHTASDVPCPKTHKPDDDRLFPRTQGKYTSESAKISVSKHGGQAPLNTTKKPQPRMGVLGQGREVGRGTDVQVPPHSSQTSMVTMGKTTTAPHISHSHTSTAATIQEVSSVPCSVYTRNEARGETDSKSTSREIRNIPVTTSTSARSTSVPTGLQSLGVGDGSTRSAAVPLPATSSTHRQHHSQENVSRSAGVCVPEQVSLGQACVLGMATYTTFTLYNPRSRWTHFSLKLVKESLDGVASNVSALLFKPSYFLEPGGRCQAKLGVCSQFKGHLEAMIEVHLADLTKEGNGPAALTPINHSSTHTLAVSASISEPDVRVWCEGEGGVGEKVLDFGVVAEGCLVSRQVTLTNLSPQSLPVILHLQQVAVTSPIFYWEPHKNITGQAVSITCLACELAAPASVPTSADNLTSQAVSVTLTVTFKAPHLDNVEVGESGVVGVRSVMQVEMDAPDQSKIIIASFPIKASIGAVCLESQRVTEPLTMEGTADTSPEASITLKSSSSFPLRVSLAVRDHKDVFSVRPDTLVVQPHSRITPCIVFTPGGWVGRVESSLVIRIEPEGMDFEISIAGVSHKARPLLPPPQPPPPLHPHPAGNPQSRKKVLGNQASSHHHTALTKSNSDPVESNPSRALESTKSRLVFGMVEVGGSSTQKLVLRNTCTSHKLSLVLSIFGSQSFQLQESVGEEHQSKVEVVLEPCQELPLSISLRPSAVEPLSATLVCKYHSVANPFKCRIPMQGYGGKGTLTIPDHFKELPFIMHSLTPGLPSLLRTPFVNTGTRAIFVKLQIFTDEECTSLVTASDFSVQPSEFVLGAGGTSRDIFLVANGTPAILAKAQGTLGYLRIVSGDEVLRQRYKRLKNKEVKVRRIKDPSLLGLDYGASFSREEGVLEEEPDTLPPQPEDATVFLNGCNKMIIELYGERQAIEDNSSTAFVIVNAEDTMSSMVDFSMTAERTGGVPSPPLPSQSCFIRPLAHPTSQAAHQTPLTAITTHLRPPVTVASHLASAPSSATSLSTPTSSNTTWDVFPQSLSIPASDTMSHDFFVVNYGSSQQTFEVRSSCPSLQVKPSEALLPGLSSVKVCVTLATPPRALSAPTSHTLKFMCENESCSVTITILPTREEGTLQPRPENLLPHPPPPPPSLHPPPPPSLHPPPPPPPSLHPPPPSLHPPPSPLLHPPPPSPLLHPPPPPLLHHPPPSLHHHHPPLHHPSSSLLHPPTVSNTKGRKDGIPSNRQTSTSKLSGHQSTTSVSHRGGGGEVSSSGRQSLVRVLVETAAFPDTVAGKESIVKVKLTNQDTVTRAVRAAVTSGPFAVRHSEFYVKPGHFSSLPVYFRPERPGAYIGRLHLTVLACNTLHTVHLSGTATR